MDITAGKGGEVSGDGGAFHFFGGHALAGTNSLSGNVNLAGDEAQYLLTCRHPSILHLVGTVTLRQGPALITERSACSL